MTDQLRFVDLFAGLGGFHLALASLRHRCVFASEINEDLRNLYKLNFPDSAPVLFGDIRECKHSVPAHDVLCAGFPCQPFSKSGYQNGHRDTRGTLFHEILDILETHSPRYVILENVGNFEQHEAGNTWLTAKRSLESLGYSVLATEHVKNGGRGLISPHHFGHPHSRERFYAVCKRGALSPDVLPTPKRNAKSDLAPMLQQPGELAESDIRETRLSNLQVECIEHWNRLLASIPVTTEFPSFPIWSDEFGATYPFEDMTPFSCPIEVLVEATSPNGGSKTMSRDELLMLVPSYARTAQDEFPDWKKRFIRQNRRWFKDVAQDVPDGWLEDLRSSFPSSLRKFEWNCHGERRDLWSHVLQFRPSGLRAKRMTSIPALVALTTTQTPIIGPQGRFISRVEARRLQGFPDNHRLPDSRPAVFQALGNAVHVDVIRLIASRLLGPESSYASLQMSGKGLADSQLQLPIESLLVAGKASTRKRSA
jgi:DNA (cytosine-5)-methyltransferase 1